VEAHLGTSMFLITIMTWLVGLNYKHDYIDIEKGGALHATDLTIIIIGRNHIEMVVVGSIGRISLGH